MTNPVCKYKDWWDSETGMLTPNNGVEFSHPLLWQPGGQLSTQFAGALALPAASFSPWKVTQASASLATAARLQMMRVETAGRWRAWEAWRRVAAAQATPHPATAVFVAGGRGTYRALQRGGAAWGHTGAAVVVWWAGQAADALPGALVLCWGAVVKGRAPGTMHQLSEACQKVWVTGAASSNTVTPKPRWSQKSASSF